MKTILFAALAATSIVLAPVTNAGTGLCGNHAEHTDQPFGNAVAGGGDPTYVTACSNNEGAANNAQVPSVSTEPGN